MTKKIETSALEPFAIPVTKLLILVGERKTPVFLVRNEEELHHWALIILESRYSAGWYPSEDLPPDRPDFD